MAEILDKLQNFFWALFRISEKGDVSFDSCSSFNVSLLLLRSQTISFYLCQLQFDPRLLGPHRMQETPEIGFFATEQKLGPVVPTLDGIRGTGNTIFDALLIKKTFLSYWPDHGRRPMEHRGPNFLPHDYSTAGLGTSHSTVCHLEETSAR
jgi:hypothetical protein